MVLDYTYEDKFIDGKLRIGLGFHGREIHPSEYRIILYRSMFDRTKRRYENKVTINFEESLCGWGEISECLCFHDDEIIATSRQKISGIVKPYTTVAFFPKNLTISFIK